MYWRATKGWRLNKNIQMVKIYFQHLQTTVRCMACKMHVSLDNMQDMFGYVTVILNVCCILNQSRIGS